MQSLQACQDESRILQHKKSLFFPEGLPAFEQVKEFVIIANEEEAPFMWLQAVKVPNLAFITVDPFVIHPDYRPDICDADVEQLELEDSSDAFVLAIVNVRNTDDQGITVNLVGPVVVNWRKQIGKQVIVQNHLKYSVRHRIEQP